MTLKQTGSSRGTGKPSYDQGESVESKSKEVEETISELKASVVLTSKANETQASIQAWYKEDSKRLRLKQTMKTQSLFFAPL